MTSSVFLDINVWLALSSREHSHFESAWAWYKRLPPSTVLLFCRITQLGLLRLLTTQSVMGQGTLTQAQAWEAYDRLVERPEVVVIMTDGGTYWTSKDRPVMVNGRPRTRLPDNTIVCVIGRSEGQMISAMPREIRRHAIFVKRDEELGRSL